MDELDSEHGKAWCCHLAPSTDTELLWAPKQKLATKGHVAGSPCSHLAPRILSLFAPGVSMLLTSSSSLRHSMASALSPTKHTISASSGRFVAAASVRLSASRCSYHSDTSDKCCEKVWDQTASASFESDHVTQVVTSQHCSINSKRCWLTPLWAARSCHTAPEHIRYPPIMIVRLTFRFSIVSWTLNWALNVFMHRFLSFCAHTKGHLTFSPSVYNSSSAHSFAFSWLLTR